jgi:DnaK suppressor protein
MKLMSESEMLKAPQNDYMSERQLAFFRSRLKADEEALVNAARETTHHLQDNEATPDWTDRASCEEEHSLELRVRDRERKLLKKIRDALIRIENRTYGWCEETGEPIGIPRLLARPTATLSLEAQERRELRKQLFGD